MMLLPRQPFNFERTLRFILSPPALENGRKFEPLLDYFEEGEYRRVANLSGQPALYGVAWDRAAKGLRVRILAGPADSATRRLLRELVARQFALALDVRPFYKLVRSDPVLSRLVRRFRGLRVPQAPNAYETLLCAVLEQQVNLAFAHQVKRALVEAYGTTLEFGGRRYRAFPAPETLAILGEQDLRRLQISGPKARYLIGLSRAVLDGSLNFDRLREAEPRAAAERLQQHKGIGPWTAQYVGLRALGYLDCLPAQDVGLQKAVHFFYGLRLQPPARKIERRARPWSGWRSYATFYLWLTYWESGAWRRRLREEIARGAERRRK